MKYSYSKILEYEESKERFPTLLENKMNKSSIKSKDLHWHKEKIENSYIQWIKDWSPFPQQGQNLGQSLETLPLLIAIVILYL